MQSIGGRRQTVAGTALNLGMGGSWPRTPAATRTAPARARSSATAATVRGSGAPTGSTTTTPTRPTTPSARAICAPKRACNIGETLRVSLIRFDVSGQQYGDIRYTKPAAQRRPTPRLSFAARPEFDGRYSYDAQRFVRRGTRLSANRYGDISQIAYDQDLGQRTRAVHRAARRTARQPLYRDRQPLRRRRHAFRVGRRRARRRRPYRLSGRGESGAACPAFFFFFFFFFFVGRA